MLKPRPPFAAIALVPFLLGSIQDDAGPRPAAPPEEAYRANNRGVGFLEQYSFLEAVAELQKAVALAPRYAQARINLAIAQFHAPDLAASRASALEAARLAPDSPQPPYLLALIARAEGDPAEAERHLQRARALDPGDAGVNVNLGQVYMEERRYDEAIAVLSAASQAEPFNVSAVYALGTALVRSRRTDEGAAVLARFEKLRDSQYKTEFGRNYLEQGRYAEALASTGAEAELVDMQAPDLAFEPDQAGIPESARRFEGRTLRLLGVDHDDDGDIDLLVTSGDSVRLLRNERGRFVDATEAAGLSGRRARAGVAGDFDNDGHADLLLLAPLALLRGDAGRFADATAASRLPADAPASVAAVADLDHDGDLDVLLGASSEASSLQLLRNNGDGTFSDTTAEARLGLPGAAAAFVPSDFDNRRDLDLFVARRDGSPLLFLNRRDGTFEDAAAAWRLPAAPARAVAAGDVNKDTYTDLLIAAAEPPLRLMLSDGRGGFDETPLGAAPPGLRSLLFADVDMDGLLDVVGAGQAGLLVLRNVGSGWADIGSRAVPAGLGALDEVVAFDADGDGDQDLVAAGSDGSLRLLRNQGGNRHRSLHVRLAGRASNAEGIGAKLELRAGSLRQKLESYATSPAVAPADILFGLGGRDSADALRILWPSGIVQTEIGLPVPAPQADGTRVALSFAELDRKPSSCPYLYAWNGTRFEFVSDFLGAGEMGYWLAPGVRNEPDPLEYVRIAPGQLTDRDGLYELRATNELEEVLYLDRMGLLAVAHPPEVEVHPAEGMTHAPRAFELFAARDLRTPRATDDAGRDWTESVARADRRFAEGFGLLAIRGYAEPHALTLELSDIPATHTLLLLTGWTDYAFSSDNFAAQQRGLSLEPPILETRGEDGAWRTVLADVGVPVGRPQTIVWDLKNRGAGRTLRLRTNMRIYWDRIALAEPAGIALQPVPVPRVRARLDERGFSAEVSVDGREPYGYDYERVSWPSPWKLMPGRYTRTGDVSRLIAETDDLFVVARPGDVVSLAFDASGLKPTPAGWVRTFLLAGDGFSKEMDLHSSSPDVAAPLPFHGMPSYPYPAEAAPATLRRNAKVQESYDTRRIERSLWPLELAAAPAPGK